MKIHIKTKKAPAPENEEVQEMSEDEEPETNRGIYYWHFRLTLSQEEATEESRAKEMHPRRLRANCQYLIDKICDLYIKPKYRKTWTAVIEYYDSKGEYTKPHLHFNFISEKSRDTMIKPIKAAYLENEGETLIGNKMFSLKPATFIDHDKWFRYALKQLPSLDSKLNLTPLENHNGALEDMRQRAHDQWIIGCEVNQSKASHKQTKEERYDRIVRFIEKPKKPTSILEITLGITNFYIKEKSPINSNTIQGYTLTYALTNGIISVLEFSKKIEKKILE